LIVADLTPFDGSRNVAMATILESKLAKSDYSLFFVALAF